MSKAIGTIEIIFRESYGDDDDIEHVLARSAFGMKNFLDPEGPRLDAKMLAKSFREALNTAIEDVRRNVELWGTEGMLLEAFGRKRNE